MPVIVFLMDRPGRGNPGVAMSLVAVGLDRISRLLLRVRDYPEKENLGAFLEENPRSLNISQDLPDPDEWAG